ncbi:hypothetical protein Pla108_24940 [Botrimarina colliarenosi]|uniref:Uncharacterized protein n=1 Tax=Botrimarina colliarenosi TaxID=2528001 RepID=A0A5C6ABD6_9BACT|nr:hypothetical protein [Botrimarina colliarenosi]TWT96720.1 hypothetical protein Pla108_24940 [Botrimarina colliarenosi]
MLFTEGSGPRSAGPRPICRRLGYRSGMGYIWALRTEAATLAAPSRQAPSSVPLPFLMPDPFDPYREALVVEEVTLWPGATRAAAGDWEPTRRRRFERLLHAEAASAAELHYVRVHTGFSRQITVQVADLDRLTGRLTSDA